jgi:hypothetical protein
MKTLLILLLAVYAFCIWRPSNKFSLNQAESKRLPFFEHKDYSGSQVYRIQIESEEDMLKFQEEMDVQELSGIVWDVRCSYFYNLALESNSEEGYHRRPG